MKRSLWKFMVLLTLLALLLPSLVACGGGEEATATSEPMEEATEPPPPATEPPAEPKTATITLFEEPDSLNDIYTTMWFADITNDFCTVGFWLYDDEGELVPEMAAEIPATDNGGISEDGKTLTIKLNPDAIWSDGTPVTAHDYVFTYDMIMDEANTVQTRYPYDTFVESVTAVDDHTVQIVMTEPYVAWASGFMDSFLPKHILEPVYEAEGSIDNADWNRNPTVCNWAFVLKEWQSASHLIFEANDNYWRGRPKLDQVFLRIVPDDEAQMAAIKTGDTDLGVYMTAADKPEIDELADVQLVSVSSGWVESWFFNLVDEELSAETGIEPGHPALQDKMVRRAIVMGVDRQQIIDELFYGLYRPPAVFWYDSPFEDTSIEPWPYDPEQARTLLDEAGWVDSNDDGIRDKDGVDLVLRYSTTAGNELREATQVVVQQMLADIGVGIEILNYSYDTIWNSYGDDGPIATGKYDIAEWSTLPADFPDPNDTNWLCNEIPSSDYPAGNNWSGVCIEELDELFAKQAVTVDPQERIEIYSQIENIMHDQMFWMGVRTDPDFWAVNTRLKNARMSGAGHPFWNAYEWDVGQ